MTKYSKIWTIFTQCVMHNILSKENEFKAYECRLWYTQTTNEKLQLKFCPNYAAIRLTAFKQLNACLSSKTFDHFTKAHL